MTDLTWEQAREKVQERHGNVLAIQTFGGMWAIQDYTGNDQFSAYCEFEEEAWLNAYTRMTDTSPIPERIAAVTELPRLELDVIAIRSGFGDCWGPEANLAVANARTEDRERQLLTALADVRKFEDADASKAAEMAALREDLESESQSKTDAYATCQSLLLDVAALRSAKEKAEAERDADRQSLSDALDDWHKDLTKAEVFVAENTRLRDALRRCVTELEFQGAGHAHAEIQIARAALSAPGAKVEG